MTVSDEIKKLCLAPDGAKIIDYERDGFAEGLDGFVVKDLRPYWTAPLSAGRRKGRCANCGDDVPYIKACGLCTLCYTDALGKRGAELIGALANARRTARERREAAPRKAAEVRRKAEREARLQQKAIKEQKKIPVTDPANPFVPPTEEEYRRQRLKDLARAVCDHVYAGRCSGPDAEAVAAWCDELSMLVLGKC